MSVILDALKRVQDENRRRGMDPVATHEHETARDADAMVERLSPAVPQLQPQPFPEIEPEPPRLSPLAWVGVITLCSVAVIAAALWWFEPDFTGARANGGRPLLADLPGNDAAAAPQSGGMLPVAPATAANTAMTAEDQVGEQNAQRAMPTPIGRDATAADDLSDLSGSLPPESSATEPEVASEPAFDLRVRQRAPASPDSGERAAPGNGAIRLSSSSPSERDSVPSTGESSERAGAGAWGDPSGNPFAAREPATDTRTATRGTLIDPGVRSGFERGLQLQKAGDLSGAEDAYLRALKSDPNNAQINANLAVLYEALGRFQLAERHLRQAINVAPKNPAAHNNLGVVLYRMGNYDGALIEFDRALSLNSGQLDAYTNKGLIFMRWGRYDDAQRAFRQVLVMDPQNALAHYNLGLVYEEMQQWDMAIESYYRFLDTGGTTHPEIVKYVSSRLPWVEARLGGQ